MKARTRILRLLGGVALVIAILVAVFALLPGWIHTWGATAEEAARALPGDGLAAAVLFLTRKAWRWPLAVGLAAVLVLVAFTFVQPPIWLRAAADLVLLAGVGWAWHASSGPATKESYGKAPT